MDTRRFGCLHCRQEPSSRFTFISFPPFDKKWESRLHGSRHFYRLHGNERRENQRQSQGLCPAAPGPASQGKQRAFRERERLHVEALELSIQELTKQIPEKTFLRSVWNAKYLRSRHTMNGSLSRLVEEYYTVLRFSIREPSAARAAPSSKQNGDRVDSIEFLSRVTHPGAILGDLVGPENMVDQWRKYTAAHAQYETHIYGLDVRGPEEDPVVFAQLKMSGRLTRKTFEMLFPHAERNESLVQQLIGKCIAYYGTSLIRFSSDMQIVAQDVHLDFIGGLVEAGVSLQEIDQLMGRPTISPTCTILDKPANATVATRSSSYVSSTTRKASPPSHRADDGKSRTRNS